MKDLRYLPASGAVDPRGNGYFFSSADPVPGTGDPAKRDGAGVPVQKLPGTGKGSGQTRRCFRFRRIRKSGVHPAERDHMQVLVIPAPQGVGSAVD